MDLDPLICSQARLSRDARFDGRFFIGVKSTRIYCRSICPVRTVKEENVRYSPTAAAADKVPGMDKVRVVENLKNEQSSTRSAIDKLKAAR